MKLILWTICLTLVSASAVKEWRVKRQAEERIPTERVSERNKTFFDNNNINYTLNRLRERQRRREELCEEQAQRRFCDNFPTESQLTEPFKRMEELVRENKCADDCGNIKCIGASFIGPECKCWCKIQSKEEHGGETIRLCPTELQARRKKPRIPCIRSQITEARSGSGVWEGSPYYSGRSSSDTGETARHSRRASQRGSNIHFRLRPCLHSYYGGVY